MAPSPVESASKVTNGKMMAVTVMIALDRKIDPAADHGDGLADADEADHRGELDDIAQVGVGAEARDQQRGRDPQDRDNRVGDERAAVCGRKAPQAQDRVQVALRKEARIKGSATVATMINP